jgi:hypothetical protein
MDPFGRRFDGGTPLKIWSSTGTSGDLNVAPLTKNSGSGILWFHKSIIAFLTQRTLTVLSITSRLMLMSAPPGKGEPG